MIDKIQVDIDQQTSAIQSNIQQEDYYKIGAIITKSNINIYLAIIADGEGEENPRQAAEVAVQTIYAECKQSIFKDPSMILRRALDLANQKIRSQFQRDYVGVTVVAIHGKTVYVGQAGKETKAYHTRSDQGTVEPISFSKYPSLGLVSEISKNIVDQYKDHLRVGDRIVICSDGLYNQVTEEELTIIQSYDNINGVAKHLSALAMGRNEEDNITVIVLSIGQKPRFRPKLKIKLRSILAGAGILILLFLAVFIISNSKKVLRPPDLGVAVLVEGQAEVIDIDNGFKQYLVEEFVAIEPGTALYIRSDQPVHLKLKRRTDLQSASTININGTNIFAALDAKLILSTLELAPTYNGRATEKELLNLTEITLIKGELLIFGEEERVYNVIIPVSKRKNNVASLLVPKNQSGALGVVVKDGVLQVDCIRGRCQLISEKGDVITLEEMSRTVLNLQEGYKSVQKTLITNELLANWKTVCKGCEIEE